MVAGCSAGVVRLLFLLCLVGIAVALPVQGGADGRPGNPSARCGVAGGAERLQGLMAQGEPVLESGEVVRLSAIRIPEEPALREAASAWLKRWVGRAVLVQEALALDRWGRRPARLVLADGSGRLDLAQGLVEAGLALVDPGAADTFCGQDLLALEETARERGLGLWGSDRYKAVSVRQAEDLRGRIGQFVLVEGRVRSVGEREHRTYLNFGTDWASDFTIIIPKRSWGLMVGRGLTAKTLTGRLIRARGTLEDQGGPALMVTLPEMIETLHGEHGRQR